VNTALSAPHDDVMGIGCNAGVQRPRVAVADNEVIFPPFLRPLFMQAESYISDAKLFFSRLEGNSCFISPSKSEPTINTPVNLHDTSHSSGKRARYCQKEDDDAFGFDKSVNWRFRVPDGKTVSFTDQCFSYENFSDMPSESTRSSVLNFTAGVDFGDFLVWRLDSSPSYELAVVIDDLMMGVTEIVRAEDLLLSTARQLLLMTALGVGTDNRVSETAAASVVATCTDVGQVLRQATIPKFCHVPLLCDEYGKRLAKRTDAKSLRQLRSEGYSPEDIRRTFFSKEVLRDYSGNSSDSNSVVADCTPHGV
jgi:glutamyl/glutaminyl-tRNA synthetase